MDKSHVDGGESDVTFCTQLPDLNNSSRALLPEPFIMQLSNEAPAPVKSKSAVVVQTDEAAAS